MKKLLTTIAGLALAGPIFASSVCPTPNGGNSGGQGVSATYTSDVVLSGGVVQNNTGCNVLIVFAANGSITTTNPNAAPSYDAGGDDNLIGIVNNTGHAITMLNLSTTTAGNDIFGFDSDGICATTAGSQTTTAPGYTFVGGGNPCSHSTDPSGYGGPFTLATSTSTNNQSGNVTFGNGGIAANGGTSWFSLEGPVDVNLVVTTTPEPGSVVLVGAALTMLGACVRRRKA